MILWFYVHTHTGKVVGQCTEEEALLQYQGQSHYFFRIWHITICVVPPSPHLTSPLPSFHMLTPAGILQFYNSVILWFCDSVIPWIKRWSFTWLLDTKIQGDPHKHKEINLYVLEAVLCCGSSLLDAAAGACKDLRSVWMNSEEKKSTQHCLIPSHQLSSWTILSPGGVRALWGCILMCLLCSCLPFGFFFFFFLIASWELHHPLFQFTTAVQLSDFLPPPNTLWAVPFPLALPLAPSPQPRALFPFPLPTAQLPLPYTLLCPPLHFPPSLAPFLSAVMFSTACSPLQHRDTKQRGWHYTCCPLVSPSAPRTSAVQLLWFLN